MQEQEKMQEQDKMQKQDKMQEQAKTQEQEQKDGQKHHSSMPQQRPFIPAGQAPEDAQLKEEIVSEQLVWSGDIFDVYTLDVELRTKKQARRDVVRNAGAVAILAITNDNRVCLVRQYRPAFDCVMIEVPAGKMEPQEEPRACALRELKEETGYEARNMLHFATVAASPGFTNETLHIYVASGLTFTESDPDEDEFLDVDLVPAQEFIDAAFTGDIHDAKTLIAALALQAIGERVAAGNQISRDVQAKAQAHDQAQQDNTFEKCEYSDNSHKDPSEQQSFKERNSAPHSA